VLVLPAAANKEGLVMAIRFPANCIIVAAIACLKPGNRMHWARNQSGRWHCYWTRRDGRSFRFYKPRSGNRTYLQNTMYIGEIKEVK